MGCCMSYASCPGPLYSRCVLQSPLACWEEGIKAGWQGHTTLNKMVIWGAPACCPCTVQQTGSHLPLLGLSSRSWGCYVCSGSNAWLYTWLPLVSWRMGPLSRASLSFCLPCWQPQPSGRPCSFCHLAASSTSAATWAGVPSLCDKHSAGQARRFGKHTLLGL